MKCKNTQCSNSITKNAKYCTKQCYWLSMKDKPFECKDPKERSRKISVNNCNHRKDIIIKREQTRHNRYPGYFKNPIEHSKSVSISQIGKKLKVESIEKRQNTRKLKYNGTYFKDPELMRKRMQGESHPNFQGWKSRESYGEKERNDKDFMLDNYNQKLHRLLSIENENYKPVLLELFLNT